MSRSQLVEAARAGIAHAKAGTIPQADSVSTIPAQHYFDRERWQQELDRIFGRLPLMLATTSELPNPGDYKAINAAGTADDMVAIATALEGMEHDSIWGGKIFMRPQDHQAIQDVHIMAHTDEGITHDSDNSGYGLAVESTVEMAAMDSETTCNMKRP